MAASPENAFQKAIIAAIGSLLSGVPIDSHPPGDRPLPYVQIGQSDTEESEIGHTIEMQLHTWSSKEGPHEAQSLMQIIREVLHGFSFSSDGWTFACCREFYATVILDVDGESWHGIQRFRAIASLT